jgi:hypothetical protein
MAEIPGVKSEERIGTIQNHWESRRGAERAAIGAKPGQQAISHSDFEFQVYLARNSSDEAIWPFRRK